MVNLYWKAKTNTLYTNTKPNCKEDKLIGTITKHNTIMYKARIIGRVYVVNGQVKAKYINTK